MNAAGNRGLSPITCYYLEQLAIPCPENRGLSPIACPLLPMRP